MQKTISLATLARDTERIARDIDAGTRYRITRRGGKSLVLMNEEALEDWITVNRLFRDPVWRAEMQQTRAEFAAGRWVEYKVIDGELVREGPVQPDRRRPAKRASRPGRAKSR